MKKSYTEPEIEIIKFLVPNNIVTDFISGDNNWGEISLDDEYPLEIEF